jgi:hypothetical protein
VNGLYRCRCVVGYRPYATNRLIVFSERQVANVDVNLKWDANNITRNMDGNTETGQFVNALTGSTVNVTLSDPYMSGIAWAALFDSAAVYTNSTQAAWNSIMLPPCGEGENESSGKCRNYPEIDDPLLRSGGFGDFAHILISFFYDVGGRKFGLDTYFRLQGFNIQHGTSYPQVTLQGVNPQTVVFNQTLANFQLEENKTLEENLTKIVNDYDYEVSFCTDPDKKETKRYLMPKAFKEKNVTASEVLKKYLDSVGGTMQTLPTREYAKKISLCTRANLNQGCSVFYLGKGLYEGYQISGNVDPNNLSLNAEYNVERGLGYNYADVPLRDGENYTLYPIKAKEREEKLRDADKVEALGTEQFAVYNKRYSNRLSTSGYVWRETGPDVKTERKQNINMYGIKGEGDSPKALLDGTVLIASNDFGRVLIGTNYFFRYCNRAEPKVCWNTAIYQESVNLASVPDNLKVRTKVKIGDVIGTASAEKPEFVRFFVGGNGAKGREITVTPGLVWRHAIPVEKLTDEEKKNIGLESTADKPSGPVTPNQTGSAVFVGRVGSTGESTGPHVHIQESVSNTLSESQLRELAGKYVFVEGKSLTSYTQGQGFGAGRDHRGIDYPIENGKEIYVTGTIVSVGPGVGGSKCGVGAAFKPPEGPELLICHMLEGSAPPSGGTTISTGSKYGTGVQTAPTSLGANITTSFKGIPRALRIVPGRTILSFVTNYDQWVGQGRPASIDPGVWIAGRFSRWFVNGVNYQWGQGDLRVTVTGITDWGNITSRLNTPTFDEYLAAFQQSGDFEETKDYYGYIRSAGDLCWKLNDGKNSCEVFCADAQQFQNYLRAGQDTGADPSVTGSYPAANCQYRGTKYPSDRVNEIINAARQGGINTKAGFAGVVGNALVESFDRLDPSADNKNPRFIDEFGRGCIGIFQWCDRKRGLYELSRSTGKPWNDFGLQMQWFVKELQSTESRTVPVMNATNDPAKAADEFDRVYERSGGQKAAERRSKAVEIFNDLDCQQVNP